MVTKRNQGTVTYDGASNKSYKPQGYSLMPSKVYYTTVLTTLHNQKKKKEKKSDSKTSITPRSFLT